MTIAKHAARPRKLQPIDSWPPTSTERWLLRLAIAVPVFVGLWLIHIYDPDAATSNTALAARGALIDWGSSDLSWIAGVYPPLSAALSALVGGHQVAFIAIAAAVIGMTGQRALGVLHRRKFGNLATALVMGTYLLSPQLFFLASRDLQSILGLALLMLALDSLETFVVKRATEQGFLAGISLGVAVMVDPSMWIYALIIAAVGPFIADRSGHLGRGAHTATAVVLAFPAAAALLFWIFVSWWFTADPVSVVTGFANPWFPGGVVESGRAALISVALTLLASPLFVSAYVIRVIGGQVRRLIAPTIAMTGMAVSVWLGVRTASGHSYIVAILLYLVMMGPQSPSKRRRVVICTAAAIQLVLAWAIPLLREGSIIGQWIITMTRALV
ncbi:hypothetical protein [Rarobacter incanus]|uniref:Uncharacterized protein n=1 Tax=Rarobacter incanus TaxID=153494 RepID=A0A542SPK7_9MICO|nr:hypothetical protein [Rarobacter incanus]TQK76495.1 hypothetical protein FB389_1171 [Rarobacter incanus]